MGGSTLLLLLIPPGGSGGGGNTGSAGATQFVGPFGWPFFFPTPGSLATAAITLGPFSASAAGFSGASATAAPTLGGMSVAAAGTFRTTATAGITLGPLVASATGTSGTSGPVTIAASVGASMAAATGRSTQGHAQWAAAQNAYWVLYLSGTQSLSAKYSTDGGATWTVPTGSPFGLTVAHGSEGRDYAFGVANLAATDVLHAQSRAYHSRFALGSTWTNTNAESAAGFGDPNSLGSAVAYDGSAVPYVAGPFTNSASAAAWKGSNADAGSSWTAGFSTKAYFNDITFWSSSFALAPIAGDMLLLSDKPASATTFTDIEWNVYSTATAGGAATALASAVTATDTNAWGAVGRTTSDVHLVVLSDNSANYVHRRFNGTIWSDGDAVPTLAYAPNSGVSLVSDGISVWAAVIDIGNNVQWSKWTSGSGWSGWATLAAHGSNARSYLTGVYSPTRHAILWAWTEAAGGDNSIVGVELALSGGSTVFAAAGITLGAMATAGAGTFATSGSAAVALGPIIVSAAGTSTGGTITATALGLTNPSLATAVVFARPDPSRALTNPGAARPIAHV